MKKYVPHIIGILLFCGAIGLTARACKITDSYSKLKGQYEEYRRIVEADAKIKDALIAQQISAIAELDKKIDTSEQVIGHMSNAIGQKNTDLLNLEKSLTQAKTDAERVPILTSMVETWSAKYAHLEGVVAEKNKQLAAWGGKFDAQIQISDAWKAKYEAEHTLRLSGETLLGKLETKYKVLKITSSFKTVAVVAAAGFIGYTLIRKGK